MADSSPTYSKILKNAGFFSRNAVRTLQTTFMTDERRAKVIK